MIQHGVERLAVENPQDANDTDFAILLEGDTVGAQVVRTGAKSPERR